MYINAVPARVRQVCKRYGPGRLPGSDRPAVGAGYAFSTAALSVTALFHLIFVMLFLQTGLDAVRRAYANPGIGYFLLLAVPFVVLTAFVSGAVAWRIVPERTAYNGPVVGLLATVLTYVFAALLIAAALVASALSRPGTFISAPAALYVGVLYAIVGFQVTFWVTLPLGAVSGWIHERAVTPATDS